MPFVKGQGGRRAGALNKHTAEIKALAMKAAPEIIRGLIKIATKSENEAVRVAASKELLDRAIGKAPQPHDGDGSGGAIRFAVSAELPTAEDWLAECQAVEVNGDANGGYLAPPIKTTAGLD